MLITLGTATVYILLTAAPVEGAGEYSIRMVLGAKARKLFARMTKELPELHPN